ncbi:MAG: glycosyltransferase [Lachnospiraceae bacterium]|nr:glycosyltransferase [Lachnospiraceae bacterium]
MVTIVTVCYNEKETIADTVESVFRQDYPDYEYIIKDGGSTDGTLEIIKRYMRQFEEKGVRLRLLTGRDRGLYDAMNTAVSEASGDWVNFMNSGDLFFDGRVLSHIFSGRDYAGAGLIYGDALEVEYGEYYYFHKCPERIRERMPFSHQSVFASRRLLERYPFDLRFRIAADYDFLLKAEASGAGFADSGVLTAVVSKDGVSSVRLKDTYLESLRIRRENGIVEPPEKELMRELQFVGLKQFGMDHFPKGLKYAIRKVQRIKRKQPRIDVTRDADGCFRLGKGGRDD